MRPSSTSNAGVSRLPREDGGLWDASDLRTEFPTIELAAAPLPQPRDDAEDPPFVFGSVGKTVTNTMNRSLVVAYKIAGFTILSLILFGLLSYIALNAFFFLHSRWVAPAIIAPTDTRVLDLRARLAREIWNRKKVEVDAASVRAELAGARRVIELEEDYQTSFLAAVSKNARFKKGKLASVRALRRELAAVQDDLERATRRFSKAQSEALSRAVEARLVDQEQRLTGEFRFAELDAKQVTLKGQKASLMSEVLKISREVQALNSVARNPTDSVPATVEGLELKRNFMNSVLTEENARDNFWALQASEEALSEARQAYEEVVDIIRESPLLLAADGDLTVAFLPYENVDGVQEEAPVYSCAIYVVWCRKVGRIGAAIEGEVVSKHPIYGHDIRGQFVRLHLDEPSSAKKLILHAGRAPLFL